MKPKISVIIITYNEASQIEECIESIKDLAYEIIVVDSISDDNTVELCTKYTDKIYIRPYLRTAKTRNWAAQFAEGDWILSVDADERYTPDLLSEIQISIEKNSSSNVAGYTIPFDFYCFGRKITCWKRGERHLRLFKRDKGAYEDKEVHAKVIVDGEVNELSQSLRHIPYPDFQTLWEKVTRYTQWDAEERFKYRQTYSCFDPFLTLLKPIYNFFKLYIKDKLFIDGAAGIKICLARCVYTFLVDVKFYKLCNGAKRYEK